VNRAIALGNVQLIQQPARGLRRMTRAALRRLGEVVNGLVTAKAQRLSVSGYRMDTVFNSVCRELLTYIDGRPEYEHVGDSTSFLRKEY
jgi:hypothetical protein